MAWLRSDDQHAMLERDLSQLAKRKSSPLAPCVILPDPEQRGDEVYNVQKGKVGYSTRGTITYFVSPVIERWASGKLRGCFIK